MAKKSRLKQLDYLKRHPYCEACKTVGQITMVTGMPHHIKSRGSGGSDEDENLLSLCMEDHNKIHKEGPRRFIEWYPLLYTKIVAMKTKLDTEIKHYRTQND